MEAEILLLTPSLPLPGHHSFRATPNPQAVAPWFLLATTHSPIVELTASHKRQP